MKRLDLRIFFCGIVFLLLIIPAIFINTKEHVVSLTDNRELKEFPQLNEAFYQNLCSYVEDRIGFRDEILSVYQNANLVLLNYVSNPLYEAGSDGHIMPKNWDPIQTYHLSMDEGFVDEFGAYISNARDISNEAGADFCFFLIPNKESVYSEYLSKGYNIADNDYTKSDLIMNKLEAEGINACYPLNEFLKIKDDVKLYNAKFDPGHWNMNGGYYGIEFLSKYLKDNVNSNIIPIEKDNYFVEERIEKYLNNSYIAVNEIVPSYSLKNKTYELVDDWGEVEIGINGYHFHTVNESEELKDTPSVLVFGDSYFGDKLDFWSNNYKEVTLIHSYNVPYLRYYINRCNPDLVVFEAVDRVIGPGYEGYNEKFIGYGFAE